MKKIRIIWPALLALLLVTSASNCKKPKQNTDKKPILTLDFKSIFDGNAMDLRTTEYTKSDGEVVKLTNWSILLSKVSLIKADDTKVLLGDGYLWIDFYTQHKKFTFNELPEGAYKGISLQFGLDSLVNHGDPNVWPADHPLNPNLTGMHWGWAGGYIFQVMDGTAKVNKDSVSWNAFSYHTVGDVFKRSYTLNLPFELVKNTSKTATVEIAFDEFFKTPNALKITDEPNNHSGNKNEINWMLQLIGNGEDAYKVTKIQ